MKLHWMDLFLSALFLCMVIPGRAQESSQEENKKDAEKHLLKLFLAGDVMTGRGIDQALSTSNDPVLYEAYVKDARDYLLLAQRANGRIKTPVSNTYIWGDALEVWAANAPDLRLINLETSITTSNTPWPGKGIHYRMHPENVILLSAAGIDHCSLANNHLLDWGLEGLKETLRSLETADLAYSGAGGNLKKASAPSILDWKDGRVLIFSFGHFSSGIPGGWAAEENLPGVNFLPALDHTALIRIKAAITPEKRPGDVVVLSIHWGGNWGYDIPTAHRELAHQLIDEAGVDLIFGHSSHHPMGLEVYRDKLIIYGAGDFLNDYEGISGHQQYRGELTLMYFPELEPESGELVSLKMVPMEIRNFRLNYAKKRDVKWLKKVLDRETSKLGGNIREDQGQLWLEWP